MSKSKSFRGDRSKRKQNWNPCGCFHCTGYDKDKLMIIKYKHLDDEINEQTEYDNLSQIEE